MIGARKVVCLEIMFALILLSSACETSVQESSQPDAKNQFLPHNTSPGDGGNQHTPESILSDPGCQYQPSHALILLEKNSVKSTKLPGNDTCIWSLVKFSNPTSYNQVHYVSFPKAWHSLNTFLQERDGTLRQQSIGLEHDREILAVSVPPGDTLSLLIQYPSGSKAYLPTFGIGEITESHYLSLSNRTSLKYLLVGFLVFPAFFFTIVYFLERDRIILAYLLFLTGSAMNMISILDTTPFFDFTPKFVNSAVLIRCLFVLGGFLSLSSLAKYIHYLLETRSRSPRLYQAGNWLIGTYLLVALVPFIFTNLFSNELYEEYLQYYRIAAFLTILYILTICISGYFRRVEFSRILLIAFSPFLFCTLYYAIRFIIIREYSANSTASLILIGGFYLTILLFGIILGVRNNLVKEDRVRLEQETFHLKELDNFKSRFYTHFTHEFRTPLTVITGVAEQLSGYDREKAMIKRNAENLLRTVNDLLDLSKLESDKLSINWQCGDVVPYLNYLTESCTSLAQEKNINLAFFSPEKEIVMDYDENMLQQIQINLMTNAIKFTPEYGRVSVVAECEGREMENLKLSVKDTGDGIPKEEQEKIFERFYQSDLTQHAGGTGIGLALVRELSILLGGSINVSSQPGKGSTFIVTLPIHRDAPMTNGNSTVKDRPSVRAEMVQHNDVPENKPLVLLVEDNNDVAEYIDSCISSTYQTRHERNGKAGLHAAFDIIPDVIISDVMMPEMDGFEMCRRLKSDVRTSHIPVIILTARATQEDKLSGLGQGADAYLTKPFNKEELLLRLANMAEWSSKLRIGLRDNKSFDSIIARKESEFLKEVKGHIDKFMEDQSFNTDQLCRETAMSRTQLHRKLKALTGLSTAAFIRSQKMAHARHLLLTTDKQVGEISVRTGFSDFSHFSRTFVKEYGRTPTELRNE